MFCRHNQEDFKAGNIPQLGFEILAFKVFLGWEKISEQCWQNSVLTRNEVPQPKMMKCIIENPLTPMITTLYFVADPKKKICALQILACYFKLQIVYYTSKGSLAIQDTRFYMKTLFVFAKVKYKKKLYFPLDMKLSQHEDWYIIGEYLSSTSFCFLITIRFLWYIGGGNGRNRQRTWKSFKKVTTFWEASYFISLVFCTMRFGKVNETYMK